MICWYCYWGVPKQVADIYTKYLVLTSETAMHYGPAHIVWEDENFETEEHIQWCIDTAESWFKEWNVSPHFGGEPKLTKVEFDLVVESLKELLLIPESIRCCEPKDYDGEHPADYPPPKGLVMVKR